MTYSEFVKHLPDAKKESDPLWARIFLRPLSLPVAWGLMRLGISGNSVSLAGVFFAVIAAFFLASPPFSLAMLGAFFFILISLGDCVDGNIARAQSQNSPIGDFMDALGGYTVYALLPLAIAFRAEYLHGFEGYPGLFMLLGATAAVSNLYMRLVHQKFENMKPAGNIDNPGEKTSAKTPLAKKISAEVGLIGWMVPLLILSIAFATEWLYILFYSALFCLAAIASTIKIVLLAYRLS